MTKCAGCDWPVQTWQPQVRTENESWHTGCWEKWKGLPVNPLHVHRQEAPVAFRGIDPKKVNPKQVRPRTEYVLLYREIVDKVGGIAVAQDSAEAWRWHVLAVGDDVKGLAPGEIVYVAGKQWVDWAEVPACKDLFVAHQRACQVVVGDPDAEHPNPAPLQGAYERMMEE